ncbi:FBD-associated F-box protein At4g10400 isoform X1 [Brassica rapa]|nr:FBD-associated F-box protein At4g10400 isoform X1 [Brassica rapa]XP_033137146.1 FBD-associated F-box protein At4g10400 isoform X1 [Brassica rapa]
MDIISGLPDELLVKILLLVPTKVAVSTSILSKRWEYLWMWLPKLDYGPRDCSESECEKLRCFLDRNLPLHRAPVIESFSLDLCCSRFKPENINMWIGIAVSHCLRELEMLYESDPAKPFVLPSNLYACKSLVVLKLDGDILLDVPTMASLPSLKTMNLQSVRYSSDKTLPLLLSKCPLLEDLVLDLCEDDTPRYLGVVVPSLQSLSLSILYNNHIIDGFVLTTPALKYFKLMDYNEHYCLIENMPNLIEAYLDVDCPDIKNLIESITSVKRLSICSKAMLDEGFVFNQLEHLEVCLCMEHSSNQLFRLLKASSNLKRLDISLMHGHVSQGMDDWNQPTTVPECILSSLQTLNWSAEYTGEPQERDIAVYILKHALHLKTATIKSSELEVTKSEMLKELELSPRASAACQLMFEEVEKTRQG